MSSSGIGTRATSGGIGRIFWLILKQYFCPAIACSCRRSPETQAKSRKDVSPVFNRRTIAYASSQWVHGERTSRTILSKYAPGLPVAYPPPRRTHNTRPSTQSHRIRGHPEMPVNRRATTRPRRADHRHHRRIQPHGMLLGEQTTGSHPFRVPPRTKEILFDSVLNARAERSYYDLISTE